MADETENDLIKNLETIKAKRGYLLPHHGLLQVSEPDLLSAYDTFYEVMTLRARNLSELSKEIQISGNIAGKIFKLSIFLPKIINFSFTQTRSNCLKI